MATTSQRAVAADVVAYIGGFAPEVQALLERVRSTVRKAAPDAEEFISYGMPAYRQHGIVAYFAAFKQHIGFYPPFRGDPRLERAAAPYAGEKGNLRFPYGEPIPFDLIEAIVLHRSQANLAKAAKPRAKTVKQRAKTVKQRAKT